MINELIEQIGGRKRLEQIIEFGQIVPEAALMARALLAVLDAKPIGITDNAEVECLLRGEMANVMPPNYRGVDKGDEVYIYTTQPATSIPDGLVTAVNRLLDSDGSRGTFSAIRCGEAREEIEKFMAATSAQGG